MSNKIPKKYDELIYEGYEELLALGESKTKIADILNERWGTEFPESSMRGRYQFMQVAKSAGGLDEELYQEKLFAIAKNRLRLKEESKILVKERSMVDSVAKQYSEKKLVADVIAQVWQKDVVHLPKVEVHLPTNKAMVPIYAFGDVHWGYLCDMVENRYDPVEAHYRLSTIFEWIKQDTLENGYDEITIADLGDQIEGASLRVSQLIRVAEGMTHQAKHYTNTLTALIKELSKDLEGTDIKFLMVSEDNHAQIRLFNTKRDEMDENLALLITNDIMNTIDTAHEFGGMENVDFIHADEILLTLGEDDPFNVVFAHGHQYGRNEDILKQVEQRHGKAVHLFVGGHWHQFKVLYKNVKDRGQQALIFLPSVVGDTDYSEQLFLSCYPGFAKIMIDLTDRISNAEVIRL